MLGSDRARLNIKYIIIILIDIEILSPERVRFAVTYTSEKAPTWSTMKKVEPKLRSGVRLPFIH